MSEDIDGLVREYLQDISYQPFCDFIPEQKAFFRARYFYVTYLSDDEKPIFKLGDRVKLKGWIENFSCDTD